MECDNQAAGVLAQIEKGNKKKQGIQVKYDWGTIILPSTIHGFLTCLCLSQWASYL